jgi:hypothetical protein
MLISKAKIITLALAYFATPAAAAPWWPNCNIEGANIIPPFDWSLQEGIGNLTKCQTFCRESKGGIALSFAIDAPSNCGCYNVPFDYAFKKQLGTKAHFFDIKCPSD